MAEASEALAAQALAANLQEATRLVQETVGLAASSAASPARTALQVTRHLAARAQALQELLTLLHDALEAAHASTGAHAHQEAFASEAMCAAAQRTKAVLATALALARSCAQHGAAAGVSLLPNAPTADKVKHLFQAAENQEAFATTSEDMSHVVAMLCTATAESAWSTHSDVQLAARALGQRDAQLRMQCAEAIGELTMQMRDIGDELRARGDTHKLLVQLSHGLLAAMEANSGGVEALMRGVKEAGRLTADEVSEVKTMVRDMMEKAVPTLQPQLLELSTTEVLGQGTYNMVRAGTYNGQRVAAKLYVPLSKTAAAVLDHKIHTEAYMVSMVAKGSQNLAQPLGPVFDMAVQPPLMGLVYKRYEYTLSDVLLSEELLDRLTLADKLGIALQVARGIRHLHDIRRIVHGDLKPSKVLLERAKDSTWKAAVCDFGSASFKALTATTCQPFASGASSASLRYAAPEVHAHAEQWRRPPSDIWSLGLILAYLFSGEPPFKNVDEKHLHNYLLKPRTTPAVAGIGHGAVRALVAACCRRLEG